MVNDIFRGKLNKFEQYEGAINLICTKFKNTINYFDVIKWLDNFESEEYEKALNVLKYINFFDDLDITEALNNQFNKIVEDLANQSEIYIISIGDFGKSGSAMMYFLNKTDAYKHRNRIRSIEGRLLNHSFNVINTPKDLIEVVNNSGSNNKVVIMIDDFFGTGDSVIEFYYGLKNGERKDSLVDFHQEFQKGATYPDLKFLSVAAMSFAVKNITNRIQGSKLYCRYVYNKAFDKSGSAFGYRGNMVPVREICYSYGNRIYKAGPLGYKNSQSLVVFSYGAPNNTLPIIWSDRNWQPIFPRFYQHKMEKAKKFRKETAYHLSLVEAIGLNNIDKFKTGKRELGWKSFTFVTKTDFLIYGVLRLKRKKRSRVVICQSLGIPSDDYDNLIKEAQQRGIVDTNEDLTDEGSMIYYGIVNEIEKIKKITESSTNHPVMYVPKSFEGNT